MSWLKEHGDAVDIDVFVVPRSSRNRVVGVHDARLKVRLNAPPVDGEANAALVVLLAKALGVRKSAVDIVSGQTGRRKVIRVQGATAEQVRALCPDD